MSDKPLDKPPAMLRGAGEARGVSNQTTCDRFTAEAFEQEREALWDWCFALAMGETDTLTRERFDADFDAELAEMRREEANP